MGCSGTHDLPAVCFYLSFVNQDGSEKFDQDIYIITIALEIGSRERGQPPR
jgi:hypothetical protein